MDMRSNILIETFVKPQWMKILLSIYDLQVTKKRINLSILSKNNTKMSEMRIRYTIQLLLRLEWIRIRYKGRFIQQIYLSSEGKKLCQILKRTENKKLVKIRPL